MYDFDDRLRAFQVLFPDAVAAQQNELILCLPLVLYDIRLTGYHLLVIAKFLVLLVVEVPERTRQVQSSVDSSHHYAASCSLDPRFLLG